MVSTEVKESTYFKTNDEVADTLDEIHRAAMYAWDFGAMVQTTTHHRAKFTTSKKSTAGGEAGGKDGSNGIQVGNCGNNGASNGENNVTAKTTVQKKTGSSMRLSDSYSNEERIGRKSGKGGGGEGGTEARGGGLKDGGGDCDKSGNDVSHCRDGNIVVIEEQI